MGLSGRVSGCWSPGGVGRRKDLVDCTIAANALALVAATGLLAVSGARETVEVILVGVSWAEEDDLRLSSLSRSTRSPSTEARLGACRGAGLRGWDPSPWLEVCLARPNPTRRCARAPTG